MHRTPALITYLLPALAVVALLPLGLTASVLIAEALRSRGVLAERDVETFQQLFQVGVVVVGFIVYNRMAHLLRPAQPSRHTGTEPRSPAQLIRDRNTARVQVGLGVATLGVAGLLAWVATLAGSAPGSWVSVVFWVIVGLAFIRKGVLGLEALAT